MTFSGKSAGFDVNSLCIEARGATSSSPAASARRHSSTPDEKLRGGDLRTASNNNGPAASSRQTERGEALNTDAWYAIWTRSHCERLVLDQLSAKGFTAFLPEIGVWSKRQGRMHVVPAPMFPGYLFVHQAMDKHAYIEMQKVRGLVRILEDGWTRLTPIPDHEVAAVERVQQAGLPMFSHGALHQGDHVRVKDGPLAGVEGIFVEDDPGTGRLVVSVGLLGRGVAVEIDGTSVEPCSAGVQ
jgi:transcriptional antiterminator RfaH